MFWGYSWINGGNIRGQSKEGNAISAMAMWKEVVGGKPVHLFIISCAASLWFLLIQFIWIGELLVSAYPFRQIMVPGGVFGKLHQIGGGDRNENDITLIGIDQCDTIWESDPSIFHRGFIGQIIHPCGNVLGQSAPINILCSGRGSMSSEQYHPFNSGNNSDNIRVYPVDSGVIPTIDIISHCIDGRPFCWNKPVPPADRA